MKLKWSGSRVGFDMAALCLPGKVVDANMKEIPAVTWCNTDTGEVEFLDEPPQLDLEKNRARRHMAVYPAPLRFIANTHECMSDTEAIQQQLLFQSLHLHLTGRKWAVVNSFNEHRQTMTVVIFEDDETTGDAADKPITVNLAHPPQHC